MASYWRGRSRGDAASGPRRTSRPTDYRRAAACAGCAVVLLAGAPASAQIGDLTDPAAFVSLFLEGCVWTAPDFRDAELVFEREGLARSELVVDRALFLGPANVVSAMVDDRDAAERTCRLVGRGVDETMVASVLRERLEEDFGVLLVYETTEEGVVRFRAPVAGVTTTVTVVPAETSEEPRALLIATMPR